MARRTGAAHGEVRGVLDGYIPSSMQTNSTSGACLATCACNLRKNVGRVLRRDQAHVAFGEGLMGQHGLGARPAIPAMQSVQRQGRMEAQPIIERTIGRLIQPRDADRAFESLKIERQP